MEKNKVSLKTLAEELNLSMTTISRALRNCSDIGEKTKKIVREKALLCLDDEIPHGIQVVVNSYVESERPIPIYADLYCEKESHKAIILGKNGEMIKKISTLSRRSVEKIIGEQINLQVYVKVKANWRNDAKAIQEFGLSISE